MAFLAFALAPGTVLASTSGVYTEEELPPGPGPGKNGGNGGNGGGKDKSGNGGSQNNNGAGGGGSNTGSDGGNADGGTDAPAKQYSNGQYNPATAGKENTTGKQDQVDSADDDSTVSVAPASGGGGDDGGSALPLIIAIVIGVPLLGTGGYFLWKRYRGSDDETREKLKSALGGGTGSSVGK